MHIDKDIFLIEEIIELVLNPKEFLEKCLEATDLLTQNWTIFYFISEFM